MKHVSLPAFFAHATDHRLAVLRALWPVIAGDAIANHSEVAGLQGEVLRIRADSSSWLRTIRDVQSTLIARIRGASGPLAPGTLAFIEGPLTPKPPVRSRTARQKTNAGVTLPHSIVAAAERIPTSQDREVFLRAAAAFKARFEGERSSPLPPGHPGAPPFRS